MSPPSLGLVKAIYTAGCSALKSMESLMKYLVCCLIAFFSLVESAEASVMFRIPSLILGPEGGGSDCGGACSPSSSFLSETQSGLFELASEWVWSPLSSCGVRDGRYSCRRLSDATTASCSESEQGRRFTALLDGYRSSFSLLTPVFKAGIDIELERSGAEQDCLRTLRARL